MLNQLVRLLSVLLTFCIYAHVVSWCDPLCLCICFHDNICVKVVCLVRLSLNVRMYVS